MVNWKTAMHTDYETVAVNPSYVIDVGHPPFLRGLRPQLQLQSVPVAVQPRPLSTKFGRTSSHAITAVSTGTLTAWILHYPSCPHLLRSGCVQTTRIKFSYVAHCIYAHIHLISHIAGLAQTPKRRIPKHNAPPIEITKPKQFNNGNIEIIQPEMSSKTQTKPKVAVDEVLINGRRYRVPERIILLDFWNKVSKNPPPDVPKYVSIPVYSQCTCLSELSE